ncbi:MAG: hypothetical protein ACFCVE_08940, partial [Phycisphaerae bacterium]
MPPRDASELVWLLLPLFLASVVAGGVVVQSAAQRLSRPFPLTPWESAIFVDAWRVTQGQAVYHLPPDGRATHMYGPLTTYATAAFVKAADATFGLDVRAARIVPAAASLCMVLAMPLLLLGRERWRLLLPGAVLVGVQLYRTRTAYAEARPDAASVALTFFALVLLYLGHERRRAGLVFAGAGLLAVAVLFKQPAAVAAGVPVLVTLLRPGPAWLRRLAWSFVAPAAVGFTMLAIYVAFPDVWFHMVQVPALFPVNKGVWLHSLLNLPAHHTLALLAVGVWLVGGGQVGGGLARL